MLDSFLWCHQLASAGYATLQHIAGGCLHGYLGPFSAIVEKCPLSRRHAHSATHGCEHVCVVFGCCAAVTCLG